eukprot:998728-Rhodomonas_salina.1
MTCAGDSYPGTKVENAESCWRSVVDLAKFPCQNSKYFQRLIQGGSDARRAVFKLLSSPRTVERSALLSADDMGSHECTIVPGYPGTPREEFLRGIGRSAGKPEIPGAWLASRKFPGADDSEHAYRLLLLLVQEILVQNCDF